MSDNVCQSTASQDLNLSTITGPVALILLLMFFLTNECRITSALLVPYFHICANTKNKSCKHVNDSTMHGSKTADRKINKKKKDKKDG